MELNLENLSFDVPLYRDETGKIRVTGTRVLLEMVIYSFNEGETPEGIVDSFPALTLPAVYAITAYYLTHRKEVDAYMKRVEERSEQVRQKIESSQTPQDKAWRETLRTRLEARKQTQP
jgi:uncharacterized protein (DUF433 family)